MCSANVLVQILLDSDFAAAQAIAAERLSSALNSRSVVVGRQRVIGRGSGRERSAKGRSID